MPESDDNLPLEVRHVLFIDIVGYSKLLNEEQKERLNQLTEIVLGTAQVRDSPDEQLVRLPTGDGMALVFRHSTEEPARCALEIAEALQKHPELPVRMGIHSGPVSEVTDVSGRTNIAGAGINMAQRVMDCGDAGHILLSQHVADDLVHSRQWASRLRDLGECEVFAVQSEIAGAVAKELKVALLGHNGQTAQLATAATPSNQNVDAYNALLQGNFYFNRRTAEDTRKAIGYYEEAIRLDPRYALAYAKLSNAAVNQAVAYGSIATKEGQETLAKASASAQRALDLDPNLADAHSAQGTVLRSIDFNFAAGEVEYRRALELAPQHPAGTSNLAFLVGTLGRLDEAVALVQRAIALDPLRGAFHTNLSKDLTALGRYDDAEAAMRKAIELQPQAAMGYQQLAIIQILRGKSAAAVEFAKKEIDPFWRTYALALAHFANGDRAEADAALKKLIDENADNGASQIASIYALRKEPDKMFEWLEHGWPTNDPGVGELLLDPFLRVYKDDSRFIAFAQKIGVMPKAAAKP